MRPTPFALSSRWRQAGLAVLSLGLLADLGCASLRQSVRGQELSYRGAWHCKDGPCEAGAMVRSTRGTREGTVNINTVKLDPKAGLAFTAAAPFDSLTATARDCEGETIELAADSIVAPTKHGVEDGDAWESWIVWVNPSELATLERGAGSCAIWKIEARATWSDGATDSLTAGVQVEG